VRSPKLIDILVRAFESPRARPTFAFGTKRVYVHHPEALPDDDYGYGGDNPGRLLITFTAAAAVASRASDSLHLHSALLFAANAHGFVLGLFQPTH
jgi:hypothetical protein